MHRYRKFITSGVGFTFLVVGVTGVLMKFFLRNSWVNNVHAWIGLGMFAFAIIHILQNLKPLAHYARDWRVYLLVVPMMITAVWIFSVDRGGERGFRGQGFNPHQLAEQLSHGTVANVAKAFQKDGNVVLASMKSAGLRVKDMDETIQELGQQNQKPPEALLNYFLN